MFRFLGVYSIAMLTMPSAFAVTVNVYTEHKYPLQYQENGQMTGFSMTVVNRLFELTGDTANIAVMPWAKAYNTALSEKDAMLFTVARNRIPEQKFHWVGTLAQEKQYFWGLKSQFKQAVANNASLQQHKISVLLSSESARYLAESGFSNLHQVTDVKSNIITMYRGVSDLMLATPVGFRQLAKQFNLDLEKFIAVAELGALDTNLSVAFNKKSGLALVARYRNALRKLQRSGELEALAEKWHIIIATDP